MALCLFPGGSRAQEPLLRAGDLAGLSVSATTPYEGKALYGYIDGGADLYHEYGFVRLNVQTVKLEREEFTAEIYRMADDSAAFGIYSVSVAEGAKTAGTHSAFTSYQALFASGPYFVRVINYTGTTEARVRTAGIALVLLKRTKGKAFRVPRVLETLKARRIRYVRGPLGVQNGEAGWCELLDGVGPYTGFLAAAADDSTRIALLRFAGPDGTGAFLGRCGGTSQRGARMEGPGQVLAVDGPESIRKKILGSP